MAPVSVIGFPGKQNGCLQLTRTEIHLPRAQIKIPDRNDAPALRPVDLDPGVPGHQGRGGIGTGDAVAGIAADRADGADLRAANQINRFAQDGNMRLNERMLRDVAERSERAYAQRAVLIQGDAPQLIQSVDAPQLAAGG